MNFFVLTMKKKELQKEKKSEAIRKKTEARGVFFVTYWFSVF